MRNQDQLFGQLLEKAKKNRKGLIMLKTAAVRCQEYELAAELRGLERSEFPETAEHDAIRKEAQYFADALALCGVNVKDRVAYIILQAGKLFVEKGKDFTLQDSTDIKEKIDNIFIDFQM